MEGTKKNKKITLENIKTDQTFLSKRNDSELKTKGTWGSLQQPSLKLKEMKDQSNMQQISIGEIKSLIKNPKQFMWVYGVELGYHLPL